MTKSRLRFSAYPATSHRRLFREVLESTEGSLRLFNPKRRDSIIRTLVTLGFGFGVLIAYSLLVGLTISRFIPSYNINNLTVFLDLFAFIGFFATMYFSIGLSDKLGTGLELRLTAKHLDRVFLVHVKHVKPTSSRTIQLLRLVGDQKDEWFNVHVSGPDLIEALKRANENIKIELG